MLFSVWKRAGGHEHPERDSGEAVPEGAGSGRGQSRQRREQSVVDPRQAQELRDHVVAPGLAGVLGARVQSYNHVFGTILIRTITQILFRFY